MRREYVDLTVLLDRSGSMDTIKSDMEGGFDAFIKEQQKIPGAMKVTLYQFDTHFDKVYEDVDIQDVPKLQLDPRSSTALLDCAFKAIAFTKEKHMKLEEKERPTKTIFIIITDGLENSSREVTRSQLLKVITEQEDKGWKFVYLGANQDAFAEAGSFGVKMGSTMNFKSTGQSVLHTYDVLSASMADYRGKTAVDAQKDDFFKKGENE